MEWPQRRTAHRSDSIRLAMRQISAPQSAPVGGDWCDAFVQGEGHTLVVGDVADRDATAARAMIRLRHLLRRVAADITRGAGPAELLTAVDQAIPSRGAGIVTTGIVARNTRLPDAHEWLLRRPGDATGSTARHRSRLPRLSDAGGPSTRNDPAALHRRFGRTARTGHRRRHRVLVDHADQIWGQPRSVIPSPSAASCLLACFPTGPEMTSAFSSRTCLHARIFQSGDRLRRLRTCPDAGLEQSPVRRPPGFPTGACSLCSAVPQPTC
jgi:hypothetical protein